MIVLVSNGRLVRDLSVMSRFVTSSLRSLMPRLQKRPYTGPSPTRSANSTFTPPPPAPPARCPVSSILSLPLSVWSVFAPRLQEWRSNHSHVASCGVFGILARGTPSDGTDLLCRDPGAYQCRARPRVGDEGGCGDVRGCARVLKAWDGLGQG